MRVCLYTETALPVVGGQEVAIDALARQFQELGHDVVVLTLRPRRRQVADDSLLPYPVVRHRRYLSTRHLLGIYGASLSSVYRQYPFDVLHCHNVYPAGYVAARWAATRRVPLVITSHACDIAPDSHLLKKPRVPARVAHVLKQASALVAISDMVEAQY
ncbi:MAG: glycosyltransferase family 4 protein, partial [Planctomycetota bacterium]